MLVGILVELLAASACIVLGISNIRGNLSALHSYHYARVREEDRLLFGRQVGWGLIIVGLGILLMGLFAVLAWYLGKDSLTLLGMIPMIVGLVAGLTLAFRAMKKYNGGIF